MSSCSWHGRRVEEQGVAVNALWPRTAIATAVKNVLGVYKMSKIFRTQK